MPACDVALGTRAKLALVATDGKNTAGLLGGWGNTPAILAQGNQIPFVSEDIERQLDAIENESLDGLTWEQHPVVVGKTIEGTVEAVGDYNRFMVALALAFGIAGDPFATEGIIAPITAPTVALAGAIGVVDDGLHRYAVTFVDTVPTPDEETTRGPFNSVTVVDQGVDGQVDLTAIPIGAAPTDQRKIYRTKANGTEFFLLTTIMDNSTTIFTDNVADSSLGVAPPVRNTTGIRATHTLDLDDDMCDIYGTMGVDRVSEKTDSQGDSVWQFGFVKFNGFVLRAEAGRLTTLQFPVLCRDLTRGVQPTGWSTPWDVSSAWQYLLHSEGLWRFNIRSAAALASPTDDVLKPATMTVTGDGKLAGLKVQDDQIDEPVRDGKPNVVIEMTFSGLTTALAALFVDAADAETLLKGDVYFQGAALGAGFHDLRLQMANIKVDRAHAQVQGPNRIALDVTLHLSTSDGSVLGMTGITKPMRILMDNEFDYDPLRPNNDQ